MRLRDRLRRRGRRELGRIVPLPAEPTSSAVLLPERLMNLRQRVLARHRFELLTSQHPSMRRVLAESALKNG